jgi:hypothetical protein
MILLTMLQCCNNVAMWFFSALVVAALGRESADQVSSVQLVSALTMHGDTAVAEAAMDVLLEFSNKKQTVAGSSTASGEWTHMVQRVLLFPCRRPVRTACYVRNTCWPSHSRLHAEQ